MKIKKKYFWAIAVLLIVGGGYFWFGKSDSASKEVQYVTATAEKGTLTVSVTGTGQIEAVNQVDLKPVVAGDAIDVIGVYVENNQEVKKGDMIALLDSSEAQKSIRDAELSLRSAQIKMRQIEKTNDTKTEDDKLIRQTQEISVYQNTNKLADAKEKLNDYYIRAPFNGIVTGLGVSAGDSVSRSDILASVISRDVKAKIVLNEIDAVRVKSGDKVIITVDALTDTSFTGQVARIDTIGTANQGVVSYNAEIGFDTQSELLKPGMNVSASVITDAKQNVLIVPSSAIKNEGNSNYVEILNAGKMPEQKIVQIGGSNGTDAEVLSGINVGDKVVTQTINPNISTSSQNSNSGSSLRIPGVTGGSGGTRNFR